MTYEDIRRLYNRVVARSDMATIIARHPYLWTRLRHIVRGLESPKGLSPEEMAELKLFEESL